jgi:dTDP-L-rhamnose 4-epimerase
LVARALENQDAVVHFAAETGTGQSMYQVTRYQETNIGGLATIFDVMVNSRFSGLTKIVLASSRAVYGEGQYRCLEHGTVYPGERKRQDLLAGKYEPLCPVCKADCLPEPTSEDAPLRPLSFYGLTKQVQEEMALMFARTCGISACVLRYQNVYGPGQSLSNPYTGILAIFAGLARSSSRIQIFEDGQESRDFIFVDDVVEATWRFLSEDRGLTGAYNVGTGTRISVLQVANEIVRFLDKRTPVSITGAFRQGDIRHNSADLSKTRGAIGFSPRLPFAEGLQKFLAWVEEQGVQRPQAYEGSLREMSERGLLNA